MVKIKIKSVDLLYLYNLRVYVPGSNEMGTRRPVQGCTTTTEIMKKKRNNKFFRIS